MGLVVLCGEVGYRLLALMRGPWTLNLVLSQFVPSSCDGRHLVEVKREGASSGIECWRREGGPTYPRKRLQGWQD